MRILKKFSILLLTITMVFGSIFPVNINNSYASTSYKNSVTNKNTLATNARLGDYFYFSSEDALYKVNVKTKKKTRLYKVKYDGDLIRHVSVYKDYIYFTYEKEFTPYIYRIKTNGKNLKCLGMGVNPKPYHNKIYYLGVVKKDDYESKTNGIYKMNLNGSNKTCIRKSKYISDFSIYNSNIYYIYVYDGSCITSYLGKINLNGNNNKKLVDYKGYDYYEILNIGGFYKGYIYLYTDQAFYKLKLSNNKLTKFDKFYNCNKYIIGVEKGYLYYGQWGSNKDYIYKLKLSNNKKSIVVSGSDVQGQLVSSDYMVYNNKPGEDYYLIGTNGKNKIYLGKSFIP